MSNTTVKIDDKHTIGTGRTFIIAEVGSNHASDLSRALESIAAAADCGADAVKFQSIDLTELYYAPSATVKELHACIDLNEKWLHTLKSACESKNVLFFSAPTYIRAVDMLAELETKLYKIASAQVGVFPQLVSKVARLGKPTLLATGLVTPSSLGKRLAMFHEANNNNYIILHCNSIYPTPPHRVCLERMDVLRALYNCPVGFSDHTAGISIPLAAVSRGADVIEKHFTLSRSLRTPDAAFSLEPNEFYQLVHEARNVEAACAPGTTRFQIEEEEQLFKQAIRYRLILKKNKREGEPFRLDDFIYKRHTDGIDCSDEELIIKRMQASRPISSGEVLHWNMLQGKP